MNWSTVRKFVAAWIGATIGHVSAGAGILHQIDSVDLLVDLLEGEVSTAVWTCVGLLGATAIYTTAVMWGYHERDKEARRVPQGVPPRNYFWFGLGSAWVVWLGVASFAGFGLDPSQLLKWLMGGR